MNLKEQEPKAKDEESSVLFTIEKLGKDYGLTKALAISGKLELPRGRFICVLGHSGSGKSTLLNLLALLEEPNEGSSIRHHAMGSC